MRSHERAQRSATGTRKFPLPSRKTGDPGPAWDLHPATLAKLFRPQASPGDGQIIARIQPLLLDGILAANILSRHFQFARTPPGSLQMRQLAHFKRGAP